MATPSPRKASRELLGHLKADGDLRGVREDTGPCGAGSVLHLRFYADSKVINGMLGHGDS